jgi:hypothetical protein
MLLRQLTFRSVLFKTVAKLIFEGIIEQMVQNISPKGIFMSDSICSNSRRIRLAWLGAVFAFLTLASGLLTACSDFLVTATQVPTEVATATPIPGSTPTPLPSSTTPAPTATLINMPPPSTFTPSTIEPDVAPCKAKNMGVDTTHVGQGATGWFFRPVFLVNTGAKPCTIQGTSKLTVTDLKGRPDTEVKLNLQNPVKEEVDSTKPLLLGLNEAAVFYIVRHRCDNGTVGEPRTLSVYILDRTSPVLEEQVNLCKAGTTARNVTGYRKAPERWRDFP